MTSRARSVRIAQAFPCRVKGGTEREPASWRNPLRQRSVTGHNLCSEQNPSTWTSVSTSRRRRKAWPFGRGSGRVRPQCVRGWFGIGLLCQAAGSHGAVRHARSSSHLPAGYLQLPRQLAQRPVDGCQRRGARGGSGAGAHRAAGLTQRAGAHGARARRRNSARAARDGSCCRRSPSFRSTSISICESRPI